MPQVGMILAQIVATMGLKLLSERVVRRVTVITLRALEAKTKEKHPKLSETIDVIADALEVPAEVSK